MQGRAGVHAGRVGNIAGGVLGATGNLSVTTPGNEYCLELRNCNAILRWPSHELSVVADLTCDNRAQIEILVPSAPITAPLLDFYAFDGAQLSSGKCSIVIESASGQVAQSHHVSVLRCSLGTENAELRLGCSELLVTTPSGADTSDLYEYRVRGLLCSGGHPVTAEFDFGEVSIFGPSREDGNEDRLDGRILVSPHAGLAADQVDAGAHRVLDILSFATGRSLRCSIRTRQIGQKLESRIWPHGDLPPRRCSPFHHRNLTPIIAAAARTYTESHCKDTGVGVAIRWSIAHSTYASVRFVQLMVALEHLIHAAESRVSLFPRQVFKELSNRIGQAIDEFKKTKNGESYRSECDALSQGISNLNQRAFKKQIRRVLEIYRVPLDGIGEHIDHLVDLRNRLVHRGVEPMEPERPVIEQELVLREIVTRTVLAILEFGGTYQSWHGGKPTDVMFSRIPDPGPAPQIPA